jgi:hypothetical protein
MEGALMIGASSIDGADYKLMTSFNYCSTAFY